VGIRVGVGVLVVALVVTAIVVVRDGGEPATPPPTPAPTATASPTPTPTPVTLDAPTDGPSLAVGITEFNPNLVADLGYAIGPEWARRRRQLLRIDPTVYRIVVPWSSSQPDPSGPPVLSALSGGCMRDKGPCAQLAGVKDQLRALAARGRQGMVVFTGMPPWAAAQTAGCERSTSSTAAGPRAAALPAYRALVAQVLTMAREEGADVRYVSPWNEPNHPYFLAPQRAACDAASPSLAAKPYAQLARAAQAELSDGQELILGETAGILEPTARATSVPELIGALPRALICSVRVWSQHAYIGGTDPVAAVTRALDARRCPRRHAIWITETGVGPAPGGLSLARGITSERQGCRLLHQRLVDWYENRRVTLAVQYTFREDDQFPTGLVTTDLKRARPALREWQAWGTRAGPAAPPPRSTCGA
jgi:hypothetical protein